MNSLLFFTMSLSLAQADPSATALKSLQEDLQANPKMTLAEVKAKPYSTAILSKADTKMAQTLLWKRLVDNHRKAAEAEIEAKMIVEDKLELRFTEKVFGEAPIDGRSLWISMHGGGSAPARVNDQQWQNQQRLYTLKEGYYITPRAPTNTWNLWHEGHIDRMFLRLIQDYCMVKDVNPNKIYLLGYSAGGDGVYQLAPRLADRLAGAAMMAGHPNDAEAWNLRNVAFALQMGGKDAAYKRNEVAEKWGAELKKLQKDDPKGYTHFFKMYPDKGHWMDREDGVALPWMAKYQRNPYPEKVVWKQTNQRKKQFYWLKISEDQLKTPHFVIAEKADQTIHLTKTENLSEITILLNDAMLNLDQPIIVKVGDKVVFQGLVERSLKTLCESYMESKDQDYSFSGSVTVKIP